MPDQASTIAADIDWVFYLIYWISVFFFALIVGVMLYFMIAYRRRPGHKETVTPTHNTALELTWTIIPLIIVLVIFYFGFVSYLNMKVVPTDAYRIYVTGVKWNWSFQYPNNYVDSNLHLPVDRPVELVITSEDVTHSLYIPAFRLKMDAVPGRNHSVWVQASEPGTYPLFCAEYCGTQHSTMIADTIVHERGQFARWLEDASNFVDRMPLHEAGERLYEVRGCKQCHSIDGTAGQGPSWRTPDGKSIWGTEVALESGETVVVDENYLIESIYEPMAKIHAGYDAIMPTYRGRLSSQEMNALIEYIKSLDPDWSPPEPEPDVSDEDGASEEVESATPSDSTNQ